MPQIDAVRILVLIILCVAVVAAAGWFAGSPLADAGLGGLSYLKALPSYGGWTGTSSPWSAAWGLLGAVSGPSSAGFTAGLVPAYATFMITLIGGLMVYTLIRKLLKS